MPRAEQDILTLYAELLHDYRQQILTFCWSHSNHLAEADMLLVDVTNAILRNVDTLHTDSSPRQRSRWLQRVMRHAYADYRKKNPRTAPLANAESIAVESDEEAQLVEALLEHLTPDERSFLEERLHGYTPDEQAAMHHLSRDAVYQRHHRIIQKLKTIYDKHYA